MAVANIEIAENRGRIFDKICQKLGWGRGALGAIKKRAKWYSDGAPTIEDEDALNFPAKAGDLVYDYSGDDAYICTVAVDYGTDGTDGTSATFQKINA